MAVLAVFAQVVVFGALVGAFQRFIGFRRVLEFLFGVFFLADIGVVFTSQLAKSLFDLLRTGFFVDPQNLVVILIVRGYPSFKPKSSNKSDLEYLVLLSYFCNSVKAIGINEPVCNTKARPSINPRSWLSSLQAIVAGFVTKVQKRGE